MRGGKKKKKENMEDSKPPSKSWLECLDLEGQISQEGKHVESKYRHWLLEIAEQKQGPAYKVLCNIPRSGQQVLRRSSNIM